MSGDSELTVSIIGDMSKLSNAFSQASSSAGSFGSSLTSKVGGALSSISRLAATVGVALGAAGLVGSGVKAATMFKDFEQSAANAASVTGKTGEAFQQAKTHIEDVSKELGANTVFSSSAAADAMYNLASAGYDVSTMTTSQLTPMLNLASGTQYDLADTTKTTASTLSQFGLGFDSAGRLADVFSAACGSTQANMTKLSSSMSQVGTIANSSGMSLEDTTAALGELYNAGMDGSTAGTGLKGVLASLISPSSQAAGVLKDMGLTVDDVNPKTKGFSNVIQTLADKGLNTTQAFQMFGRETAPAILALTSKSKDLGELTTQLGKAGGTAQTLADEQLDTLSGSLELLKSALDNAFISVGETMSPAIREIAKSLGDVIPGVQEFAVGIVDSFIEIGDKISPGVNSLKTAAGNVSELFKEMFDNIGIDKSGIIDTVAGAFNLLASAIEKVTGFAKDHPTLTKYVLAVAALATGLAVIPAIVASVTAAFAGIAAAITGFGAAAVAGLTIITGPIGLTVAAVALLALAWKNNWFGIQDVAASVWGNIKTTATNLSNSLSLTWNGIIMAAGRLKTNLSTVWNVIKTSFQEIYYYIHDWSGWIIIVIEDWISEQAVKFVQAVSQLSTLKAQLIAKWNEIQTSILAKLNGIITDVQNWIGNLGHYYDLAKDAVTILKMTLLLRWAEIKAGILAKFNEIVSDAQNWISRQKEKFNQAILSISNFKTQALARWTEIKAGTLAKLNEIINDAQNWISRQKEKLNNAITQLSAFKTQALAKWAEIKAGILAKFNEIVSDAQNWVSKQKEQFNSAVSAVNDLKTRFIAGFKAILSDVKTVDIQIITAIGEIPKKVLNLATDFYNAGVQVVQKLVDGLLSKLSSIKEAVSKITSAASLSGLSSSVTKSTSSLGSSLSSSIKSAGSSAKVSLSEAAQGLKRLLPNSPAKEGPFHTLPNWDAIFLNPLQSSISKVQTLSTPLENALSDLKSPIDSNTSSGINSISNISNSSSINYAGDTLNIGRVTITDAVDILTIFTQFEKYTANKRRQRGL